MTESAPWSKSEVGDPWKVVDRMVEIGAADGEAEDEGRKPQDNGWLLIVGNSLRDKSEILLKRVRWEGST